MKTNEALVVARMHVLSRLSMDEIRISALDLAPDPSTCTRTTNQRQQPPPGLRSELLPATRLVAAASDVPGGFTGRYSCTTPFS